MRPNPNPLPTPSPRPEDRKVEAPPNDLPVKSSSLAPLNPRPKGSVDPNKLPVPTRAPIESNGPVVPNSPFPKTLDEPNGPEDRPGVNEIEPAFPKIE